MNTEDRNHRRDILMSSARTHEPFGFVRRVVRSIELLTALAVSLISWNAYSQGEVNMINNPLTPVIDGRTGLPVIDLSHCVGLYYNLNLNDTNVGACRFSFVDASKVGIFNEGLFYGGSRVIPGTSPGDVVELVVKVWERSYASFEEQVASGEGFVATSIKMTVALGGGPLPPPSLVVQGGFPGVTTAPVPEPPADLDSDCDGVPDVDDAFPYDSGEAVDTDVDGIGDNADPFPKDPANSIHTIRSTIELQGQEVRIGWETRSNLAYQVQFKKTLDAKAWTNLGSPLTGTASFNWINNVISERQSYYRVAWLSLAWIPPGTFTMGSPSEEVNRNLNEGPQRLIEIPDGFWMGRYEVTQGEYQEVMGNNPSFYNGFRNTFPVGSEGIDFSVDLSRPVEQVSWNDATNYCATLTQRERALGNIPQNWVYRLPTEAEWEYACRAETTTRFSYGDDTDYTEFTDYGWYFNNSGIFDPSAGGIWRSHPVGQKQGNPWGLYDMHGNITEWCGDWYTNTYLIGDSYLLLHGPATGDVRVRRGGGMIENAKDCRSASRFNLHPDNYSYDTGFRVVLSRASVLSSEVRAGLPVDENNSATFSLEASVADAPAVELQYQ